MPQADLELMRRAVRVGQGGDPSPNPHVGCVIVDTATGEVIAEAHHQAAGEAHAEVLALEIAGERAKGATAYVTLEPCNHHGRTAPCVDALIRAGVARVVVGSLDPNPHVEGGGVERLRAAGIQVDVGVGEKETGELIEPWRRYITRGRSFLSLKLAMSLDGRIASRTGASKWITSAESRAYSHKLRSTHDAVMVGIKTVLADDPRLTVRALEARNPIRVIVDSKLRLSSDFRVVKTSKDVQTCVITTDVAERQQVALLERLGVTVIVVPRTADDRCDMRAALAELAKREVVSVLCEGGSELAGSLLAGRLVDRLHAFIGPVLLGPRALAGATDWAGPGPLEEAPRLLDPRWELHGTDAYVTGTVHYPDPKPAEPKPAPTEPE